MLDLQQHQVADVSGFYGRTGNVGLIASDHITTGDITSRNINSSGIVTATKFVGSQSRVQSHLQMLLLL